MGTPWLFCVIVSVLIAAKAALFLALAYLMFSRKR